MGRGFKAWQGLIRFQHGKVCCTCMNALVGVWASDKVDQTSASEHASPRTTVMLGAHSPSLETMSPREFPVYQVVLLD